VSSCSYTFTCSANVPGIVPVPSAFLKKTLKVDFSEFENEARLRQQAEAEKPGATMVEIPTTASKQKCGQGFFFKFNGFLSRL
jgi:hypothetical protein